jgi:hypothetical protein
MKLTDRLRTMDPAIITMDDCRMAAGRIEELEAGWISVEDRLPEEKDHRGTVVGWRPKSTDGKGGYSLFWYFKEESMLGLTHWMPLPTPPQQDSNE